MKKSKYQYRDHLDGRLTTAHHATLPRSCRQTHIWPNAARALTRLFGEIQTRFFFANIFVNGGSHQHTEDTRANL